MESSDGTTVKRRPSNSQTHVRYLVVSTRADATKALVEGYDEINDTLVEIAGNEEEKAETREEARGLAAKMNQLETGILAPLWHHILHCFHANSQALQSADQDLNSAVAIYESLIDFIGKQHARFEEFEAEGKKLSQCDQYVGEEKSEIVGEEKSEIAAMTSQDQRQNCHRPLPISSIRIHSLS